MTELNQTRTASKAPVRIDHDTLVEAAELVLKVCFSPKFGWTFKSNHGIPMGISGSQQRAVRKLAALFDIYDDYHTPDKRA